MKHQYAVADCPGFVPGMSLPQDVCERCGGDKWLQHARGMRSEASGRTFVSVEPPKPALSQDQIAQGVRILGPFPLTVAYPCGCNAAGSGLAELPADCPTHGPAVREIQPEPENTEGTTTNAD